MRLARYTGDYAPVQQLQGHRATNETVAALPEGKKVGGVRWQGLYPFRTQCLAARHAAMPGLS